MPTAEEAEKLLNVPEGYQPSLPMLRLSIDSVDEDIMQLVLERDIWVAQAKALKQQLGLPVRDLSREHGVVAEYSKALGKKGERLAIALLDREC